MSYETKGGMNMETSENKILSVCVERTAVRVTATEKCVPDVTRVRGRFFMRPKDRLVRFMTVR